MARRVCHVTSPVAVVEKRLLVGDRGVEPHHRTVHLHGLGGADVLVGLLRDLADGAAGQQDAGQRQRDRRRSQIVRVHRDVVGLTRGLVQEVDHTTLSQSMSTLSSALVCSISSIMSNGVGNSPSPG